VVLLAQLAVLQRYTDARLALEYTGSTGLANPAMVFEGSAMANAAIAERGVTGAIAQPLFATYLVPFELTSILLLTAIVGAVVLAKRKL
jgi:NADH-quinone oxidoreductase subunit J